MELIFYLLLLFAVLVPMIVYRDQDVSASPFYLEPDDGRRHKFPPEDIE